MPEERARIGISTHSTKLVHYASIEPPSRATPKVTMPHSTTGHKSKSTGKLRSSSSKCPARFDWSSVEVSLGSLFAGYRDDPRAGGEPPGLGRRGSIAESAEEHRQRSRDPARTPILGFGITEGALEQSIEVIGQCEPPAHDGITFDLITRCAQKHCKLSHFRSIDTGSHRTHRPPEAYG